MGKNKLSKFDDMDRYPHVFQCPYSVITKTPFELKGHWNALFFHNSNPITLELGCGRAEYAVSLARMNPDRNYVAIDIKGARMWTGATQTYNEGLKNIAFIRTHIELIDKFFDAGEVDEIWITFPDPQMKKFTKRLTSTTFLERYRSFLSDGGLINLKTDSNFLFTYTKALVERNNLPVKLMTDNLYGIGDVDNVLSIKTYYEQQWLARKLSIKYIGFYLPAKANLEEPDIEIELDDYRSYKRDKRSGLEFSK